MAALSALKRRCTESAACSLPINSARLPLWCAKSFSTCDIPVYVYTCYGMNLVSVYRCFCDQTRLRILHLLANSPLCVCHFQEILGEPQVKISKHLAYLRNHRMVSTEREQNWIIYSL